MSKISSVVASTVFGLILLAAAVTGQQAGETEQAADVVSEEIFVTEVFLDVQVTDEKGNVIAGLGPEDFVVEEEGEPVEVTSVTFYSSRGTVDAEPGTSSARTDRYFILFFHDQRISAPALTANQLEASRYARRWVEEELLPDDRVAVLGYDVKLKVYQDFTDDRPKVLAAVERAASGKKGIDNWPSRLDEATDPDSPSLLVGLPTGKLLRKKTGRFQQALELVGLAAAGFTGRKNLVLFSAGFGELTGFGQWVPDPRFYPGMKQALDEGNVAVYSIDLVAARSGRRPTGPGLHDSLNSISADTGGEYYFNFTNVLTPLRQIEQANEGYYLLSYTSRFPTGSSGYRKVSVRARQDAFRVEARDGYLYGTP